MTSVTRRGGTQSASAFATKAVQRQPERLQVMGVCDGSLAPLVVQRQPVGVLGEGVCRAASSIRRMGEFNAQAIIAWAFVEGALVLAWACNAYWNMFRGCAP